MAAAASYPAKKRREVAAPAEEEEYGECTLGSWGDAQTDQCIKCTAT